MSLLKLRIANFGLLRRSYIADGLEKFGLSDELADF